MRRTVAFRARTESESAIDEGQNKEGTIARQVLCRRHERRPGVRMVTLIRPYRVWKHRGLLILNTLLWVTHVCCTWSTCVFIRLPFSYVSFLYGSFVRVYLFFRHRLTSSFSTSTLCVYVQLYVTFAMTIRFWVHSMYLTVYLYCKKNMWI